MRVYSNKRRKLREKITSEIILKHSPSVALIPIDATPIRKKVISNCKKTIKELDKARIEIENFEKIDQPAYSKWYNFHFGNHLTELREIHEKAYNLFQLLRQIEEIKYEFRLSFYEAYLRAMDMKAHPEKYSYQSNSKKNNDNYEDEFGFDGRMSEEEMQDLFETLLKSNPELRKICRDPSERKKYYEKFKKEAFGIDSEEEETLDNNENIIKDNDTRSLEERLKHKYRTLVRKLHPDYRKEQNPRLDELWHEVQIAYKSRDLERLDTLLAMSDVNSGTFNEESSISQIISVHKEFKNQLKAMRSRIRRAKKDISWGFTKNKKTNKIQKELKIELEVKIKEERANLSHFESLLKQWSTPPQKSPKIYESSRIQGKRRNFQDEPYFDFETDKMDFGF